MRILATLVFIVLLTSCGGGGSSSPAPAPVIIPNTSNVLVSWTGNHEKSVNQVGGGYRLYYSNTSGFSIGSATVVDVPYVSGATSPISTTLSSLADGTYYLKLVAYSVLNPPGSMSGSSSEPSSQFTITVP